MKKIIIGALLCGPLLLGAQTQRPPDSLISMSYDQLEQFIVTHPGSQAGFNVLRSRFGAQNHSLNGTLPVQVNRMYDALLPRIKNSKEGKAYRAILQKLLNLLPGATAPGFSAPDGDGKTVSLSSFRGKYVLLDFWASWCIPCRKEFPWLKKAYAKYKDKNFEIVGYSLDNDQSLWLSAIDNEEVPWTQLSLLKGVNDAVATLYEVHGIPENWLIDPNGKIVAVNLRGEKIEKTLSELIK